MDQYELIKQIPLFNSLNEEDLTNLLSSLRLLNLRQGQSLFRKGDEGTSLYIVKKGTIKIVLPSKIGDEIIVTMFSEGDFLGEMALLDGQPRSADAIAVEPTEVFILQRNDFLSFLQSNSNAIKAILSLMSTKLRKTDELLEDSFFLNISGRLAKKLAELAKQNGTEDGDQVAFELTLTQKELGDTIGATRESINKELKKLKDKGLIVTEGNRVTITDLPRLKRKFI